MKTNQPVYFFVAFTKVQLHQTIQLLKQLKELAPGCHVEATTSSENPIYVTYIATSPTVFDFKTLSEEFGKHANILRSFSSTTKLPTYFYGAHIIHSPTPAQSLQGAVSKLQKSIEALIALMAPLKTPLFTPNQTSILIESYEPIRDLDVKNLNNALQKLPFKGFLSTQVEE